MKAFDTYSCLFLPPYCKLAVFTWMFISIQLVFSSAWYMCKGVRMVTLHGPGWRWGYMLVGSRACGMVAWAKTMDSVSPWPGLSMCGGCCDLTSAHLSSRKPQGAKGLLVYVWADTHGQLMCHWVCKCVCVCLQCTHLYVLHSLLDRKSVV